MQLNGSQIRIRKIRRERVKLIFSCGMTGGVTPDLFVLFDEKGRGTAALKAKKTGRDTLELVLNIADAGDGVMLPSGSFRIAALYGETGKKTPDGVFLAAGEDFRDYRESLAYGRQGFAVHVSA